MSTEKFFAESTEQSQVKATIVAKYFLAWASVVKKFAKRFSGRIAYFDLFAGPGRYKDGSKSTPIMVLENAIEDPDLCKMLVTVFNDRDEENCKSLELALQEIPGIEKLKYPPEVFCSEVGDEFVEMFNEMHVVPSLFFIDPWGYKGLSFQLINAVLKDWGCDCIFFFNYTRINMGLKNEAVKEPIDALFGGKRAESLRARIGNLNARDRELAIIEELCQALGSEEGRYVLPFRFRNEWGTRTRHHLIFVSKHHRGYEIMKHIMARESSLHEQGVPSFEYSPADKRFPTLFELSRPLDDLEVMLVDSFKGKTLTMIKIYENHNIGTPFIKKNYKDVLVKLEEKGSIVADPSANDRPKRSGRPTFADKVKVTFLG